MNDQGALIPSTDLRHQTGLFMTPDLAAGAYMTPPESPQNIPSNHLDLCQESIREWLTNETKTNPRQKESCVRWKTKFFHKEKIKAPKTASNTVTSGAEAGETSGIVVNLKKRGPQPKTDAQYEQDIQEKEELLMLIPNREGPEYRKRYNQLK